MNDDKIRQIAIEEIDKSNKNIVQFNYVAYHVHNGLDTPKIDPKNLMDSFRGSVTYDPPSLNDGAGTTTTVTVIGTVLSDFVIVSFSLDLQGITVTGYVSANDTVSVRLQNETGGTINLASGTLSALTIRNN